MVDVKKDPYEMYSAVREVSSHHEGVRHRKTDPN
jgi:hypothetical protein